MKRRTVVPVLAAGLLAVLLTACAPDGGAPEEDSLRLEASATAEAPPPEGGEEEEAPPEEEPLTLEAIRGVSFQDVAEMAYPVLRHRIIPSFDAISEGIAEDDIIRAILEANGKV